MSDRLTPEREAEIAERVAKRTAEFTEWLNRYSPMPGGDAAERAETVLEEDVPALLAELAAVRAERDQARRDAELQRADYFSEAARLLEDAGYDDDSVNLLDNVADGIRTYAEDQNDKRRRIYIDGKGRAWIDAGIDSGGLQWIAPIDDAAMEATREAVNAETGSLREIGRCW